LAAPLFGRLLQAFAQGFQAVAMTQAVVSTGAM
jgi:hypothetical protein